MKCSECIESGKKSRVYIKMRTKTCMSVSQYYDEDGKLVVNDPNITTTSYSCSNGHSWISKILDSSHKSI